MVDPFLPTVKFVVDQSAPSAITTLCPVDGVAGKVIVNVPPEVSAINLSPLTAV
jgi:hypothetical protein